MAMLVITRGYMNSRTFGRLLPSTYKRCLHWLIEGCFNDFVPTNRLSNAQWKRRNRTLQSAIALPVHQDCICILATKGRNATSATILKYGSKDVPTSAKLFVSTMISQVAHIEHVHYYLTIYCIIYVSTVQYKYIYISNYIQISCICGYTMIYTYIYTQEVQRLLKKNSFPMLDDSVALVTRITIVMLVTRVIRHSQAPHHSR